MLVRLAVGMKYAAIELVLSLSLMLLSLFIVHCDDEGDDEERNERSATIQNVNLGGIDLTPKTPALLTVIDATFFFCKLMQ